MLILTDGLFNIVIIYGFWRYFAAENSSKG